MAMVFMAFSMPGIMHVPLFDDGSVLCSVVQGYVLKGNVGTFNKRNANVMSLQVRVVPHVHAGNLPLPCSVLLACACDSL